MLERTAHPETTPTVMRPPTTGLHRAADLTSTRIRARVEANRTLARTHAPRRGERHRTRIIAARAPSWPSHPRRPAPKAGRSRPRCTSPAPEHSQWAILQAGPPMPPCVQAVRRGTGARSSATRAGASDAAARGRSAAARLLARLTPYSAAARAAGVRRRPDSSSSLGLLLPAFLLPPDTTSPSSSLSSLHSTRTHQGRSSRSFR